MPSSISLLIYSSTKIVYQLQVIYWLIQQRLVLQYQRQPRASQRAEKGIDLAQVIKTKIAAIALIPTTIVVEPKVQLKPRQTKLLLTLILSAIRFRIPYLYKLELFVLESIVVNYLKAYSHCYGILQQKNSCIKKKNTKTIQKRPPKYARGNYINKLIKNRLSRLLKKLGKRIAKLNCCVIVTISILDKDQFQ